MAKDSNSKSRAVVVCTNSRGVFFGYTEDSTGDVIHLTGSRNCYYWSAQGEGKGVLGLGEYGPGKDSKVGSRADIELRGVSCVIECTEDAERAWEEAVWT